MENKKRQPPRYPFRGMMMSALLSVALIGISFAAIDMLTVGEAFQRLGFPLFRLMGFICIGLFAGQIIEAAGWTRYLAFAARPLFRFGRLGDRCGAAFVTAFISGAAANAMLYEFYEEQKITRQQVYLTNFVNQFPAYFLHLPTTVFIVLPLTGQAGILYFVLTFTATVLRTFAFLGYGRIRFEGNRQGLENTFLKSPESPTGKKKRWQSVKEKLPKRLLNIVIFVIPIYIAVFLVHGLGWFDLARNFMATHAVLSFAPMESVSLVILGFAAEFTSGFAAAGALMDAGVLTVKQTTLALISGNIIAFPIRALRHQLPRYMGIYPPRMGFEILMMGQAFRVISLVLVAVIYYFV